MAVHLRSGPGCGLRFPGAERLSLRGRKEGTSLKDSFSAFHPAVNFLFFAAAVFFGMFFMHPVFLGISLAASLAYALRLGGRKTARLFLLGVLPLLLLVAVLNPLLNHAGVTILVYVNDNPITLEAILFGAASGVMFASVLLWFSCYNAVMTSDKFLYLFGRVIPALSLIFSMALRFVPRFAAQLKIISNAQKCVGRDLSQGNLLTRARNGLKIFSILITWALENAVDTADSHAGAGAMAFRDGRPFPTSGWTAGTRPLSGCWAG